MESCISLNNCELCLEKLKNNSPEKEFVPSKKMMTSLKDFLCTLDINEEVSASSPQYSEETLATVILQNVSKFKDNSDVLDYLNIFSFEPEIRMLVSQFIMCLMKDALIYQTSCSDEVSDDDSDDNSSGEEEKLSDSSEYFDSSSDDLSDEYTPN